VQIRNKDKEENMVAGNIPNLRLGAPTYRISEGGWLRLKLLAQAMKPNQVRGCGSR